MSLCNQCGGVKCHESPPIPPLAGDLSKAKPTAFLSSGASPAAKMDTVTLYRPVGPQELALIEAVGWRAFPPRLAEQPIFYPVLNEEYAIQIARDWNARESGAGFVTRFRVAAEFIRRYPVRTAGAAVHQELWIPAEELAEFNQHIVGLIEVIAESRC